MTFRLLALALALALVGCVATPTDQDEKDEDTSGDRTTPTATVTACEPAVAPSPAAPPIGQSQAVASNEPGAFTYSGQVSVYSHVESFVWENPQDSASIDWAGQTSTGTYTLTLLDACGEETFRKEYGGGQGAAHEEAAAGTPGSWLITLDFKVYTGQMGLSVTSA